MLGIDYAWANPKPTPAQLKAAGVAFIARYLSHDPSKDLILPELRAAEGAGMPVVVVWEQTASRMLSGRAAGIDDAQNADGQASLLGMNGAVIYFACDFDATAAQQAAINAYLGGAVAVLGRTRVGIYGGYWPVSRALDAGRAAFAWQTYAWSGGNWDSRASIRQTHNGVTVAGASADWDVSETADFGQWPRPGAVPQKAPAFPYPAADYLGLQSTDPRCHSGFIAADQPAVRTWQGQMAHRGWAVPVSGTYGTQSDQVCRAFQSEKGLAADGKVGPVTWAAAWTAQVT